ncbi:MAG: CHAD domain-containing protein [Gemmatimonadetes bacterium]|nr:CHAD domain-containing protein [Gemmatimonadota bacterium]
MSTPSGVSTEIVRQLRERLDGFRDACQRLDEDPAEGPVHDLRVSARRLHAALTLFAPLLDLPVELRPGSIRRVERRFGALRDLDVQAARLAALPDGVEEARRELERERTEAKERGGASLRRRPLRRTLGALGDWCTAPGFTPLAQLPPEALTAPLLAPTLSLVLLHPGWLIPDSPAPDEPGAADLHALRRCLKRLRYSLECVTGWCGDEMGGWLDELHAMQDALGAWHDEGILRKRLARHVPDPDLLRASASRARAALEPWPAWRERYLDPGVRAGLYQRIGGAAVVAAPPIGA